MSGRVFLTSEAADYLGVSTSAVVKAIHRGRLLAWRHGRDWQIDGLELKRWDSARSVGRPRAQV